MGPAEMPPKFPDEYRTWMTETRCGRVRSRVPGTGGDAPPVARTPATPPQRKGEES
ncbi:hypothetical protein [Actinophytocola glycyrrhizae]|uniref:Uncharacterized protein n=1 Tax=Actinophytocola glycyrrhizae TaxID=2044873 RepID=A0ABV9S8A3_9PSEU